MTGERKLGVKLGSITNAMLEYLKSVSPYDTGNLREVAIQKYKKAHDEYIIIVNADYAPYAVYTNEPWKNGKKNPNEHWIDMAVQQMASRIAAMVGGEITSAKGEMSRW